MTLGAPKKKTGAWMLMVVTMWMLNKIQTRIQGNILRHNLKDSDGVCSQEAKPQEKQGSLRGPAGSLYVRKQMELAACSSIFVGRYFW